MLIIASKYKREKEEEVREKIWGEEMEEEEEEQGEEEEEQGKEEEGEDWKEEEEEIIMHTDMAVLQRLCYAKWLLRFKSN